MGLPVSSSDAPSENGPSILKRTFSQTAMATIRRRMSTGKSDTKPGTHKRKLSLSNHIFGNSSNMDLHVPNNSKVPSGAPGIPASGKSKIMKMFLLVDDARVQYRLTARWELGGSLHLWSQCVHPRSFSR